ncbi:hypothetical protein MKW92_040620 [Papaver armeniacum]|nr:hypothetical protein MKW92_040620 [Papaver armeniacum]
MAPKRARVSKPNADDDEISSSSQWICETVKEFHPDDDKTEASEEYLSLYLKKGKFGFHSISSCTTFKPDDSWYRYMKRSELETSNYLKDDCLNFHCTIRVVKTRVEEGKHYVIPVPPSDMSQNLKAMFFGLVGNPDMETVTIEEFDPFAFKAMLLYLYSDELPEARELSDSDSTCTSTIIMQHLLIAADRFGLARLKLMCEAKLCEEITANNVATTLVLADKHQFLQLKTICLNFGAKAENVEGE